MAVQWRNNVFITKGTIIACGRRAECRSRMQKAYSKPSIKADTIAKFQIILLQQHQHWSLSKYHFLQNLHLMLKPTIIFGSALSVSHNEIMVAVMGEKKHEKTRNNSNR